MNPIIDNLNNKIDRNQNHTVIDFFSDMKTFNEMQQHMVGLIYSPDKKHYLFKDYDKIYLYSSSHHESVLIFSFYQFMLEVYNQDKNIADISYYKLQLFWDDKSEYIYLHFNNYLVWRYSMTTKAWEELKLDISSTGGEIKHLLSDDVLLFSSSNGIEGNQNSDLIIEYFTYNLSTNEINSIVILTNHSIWGICDDRLLVSKVDISENNPLASSWSIYDFLAGTVIELNLPSTYTKNTSDTINFYPNKPHILSLLYYADGKTFLNLYNYQSGAAVDIHISDEPIGSLSSWYWNVDGTGFYTGTYMVYPDISLITDFIE